MWGGRTCEGRTGTVGGAGGEEAKLDGDDGGRIEPPAWGAGAEEHRAPKLSYWSRLLRDWYGAWRCQLIRERNNFDMFKGAHPC